MTRPSIAVTVALACAALGAPPPASALQVTGVTVDLSTDGGGSWTPGIAPGTPLKPGDRVRINLALRNDTGRLGDMCADGSPPGTFTCGAQNPPVDPYDWLPQNNDPGGMTPAQYWVWPTYPGTCPADCPAALSPGRADAPLSFVSADPVLTFDYNAQTWASAGAGDETATASWVFQLERTACNLDFRVYAVDGDDHYDMIGGYGVQNMPDLDGDLSLDGDGTWWDCSAGVARGDGTLDGILAAGWGGTLCITSPVKTAAATVVASPGTRPVGVAYVGDRIELRITATNTGGVPVSVGAGEACAAFTPALTTPSAGIGLFPLDAAGSCPGVTLEPGSPAPPVALAGGASATFVWTFTITGRVGCGPFAAGTPGATGAGTAAWTQAVEGAGSCAALSVVPAPVAITATVWVDPDGAGGAYAMMPLGVVAPGTDFAGPVYVMGAETFEVRFTYRNTSPTHAVDVEPAMGWDLDPTAFLTLAGPVPAGPQLLAPGATVTVTWTLARNPAGPLQGCGSPVLSLNLTTSARGACHTQPVELRDLPFRPGDACGGGCPTGSRNLTFAAPRYADQGSVFPVTLRLRSAADRPFVLDPAAAFWMNLTPTTGAASLQTAPPGPPQAWAPGESRTFAWSYKADAVGDVLFDAGVDLGGGAPPCVPGCREGLPYCDGAFTVTTIVPPGILQVTRFAVTPAVACNAAGQWLTVELDLLNTSGTECFTVQDFCGGGVPESYPALYAPAAGPPAPASPLPALPFTVNPGQTRTVTFTLDPDCPDPTAGVVTLGCFSGGQRLVQGDVTDCGAGAPVPGAADWSGVAPSAAITTPAFLTASVWTDRPVYSVGQTITVRLSVSNEGGNTLTGFGASLSAATASGAAVSAAGGPVPAPPATYPGSGQCQPATPSVSRDTYAWQFTALQKGTVTFTANASGQDPTCAFPVTAVTSAPAIRIADAATLVCADPAGVTPVVTMSVSCTGCSATGACDPVTGQGCLEVRLDVTNLGEVDLAGMTVSLGDPGSGYLGACLPGGCPGSVGAAVLACPPPHCGDCAPAEACAPGSLAAGASRVITWRYLPTATGCLRAALDVAGTDAATGAPALCGPWSGCAVIKPRRPMRLRLTSAPARVAPGQSFEVEYATCNPGDTVAALQSGQPALGLRRGADGSPANEWFDVLPPGPVALANGECRVDRLTIVVRRETAPGAYDLRLPEGVVFMATDLETGYAVPAEDAGSALRFEVADATNRIAVEGDNRTRILAGPVRLTWRLTSTGRGGRTTIRIYALAGDLVRSLLDEPAAVKDAAVEWDGRNDAGQVVAAGVYLARLDSPAWSGTAKVVVLK